MKICVLKKAELVMTLGNASKVYEADAGMLMRAGFSKQQYDHFHGDEIRTEVNRILETCGKKRIDILTISDEEYPEMLKYISDPPLVLYVRGYIPKSNSIAIVGSRKASGYGIETANKMAFNLALADINIVSGMARGIDTAAHAGALEPTEKQSRYWDAVLMWHILLKTEALWKESAIQGLSYPNFLPELLLRP